MATILPHFSESRFFKSADSQAFQKSVGLNGVGTKAVNALSAYFQVQSFRGGQTTTATFKQGVLRAQTSLQSTQEPDGTRVVFEPDTSVFKNFSFVPQFIKEQIWNYVQPCSLVCV